MQVLKKIVGMDISSWRKFFPANEIGLIVLKAIYIDWFRENTKWK